MPPQIVQPSKNGIEHTVIEGSGVELICVATGIPVPLLTWLKDGNPVDSSLVSVSINVFLQLHNSATTCSLTLASHLATPRTVHLALIV